MLVLYRTKIIKVTDRFRRIVIRATLGLMVFYLVSFVISLFGGGVVASSTRPAGSASASASSSAGLAAMNLALDFDFIERGVQGRACRRAWSGSPPSAWWSPLVWLYLEILRLLSKLNRR